MHPDDVVVTWYAVAVIAVEVSADPSCHHVE